MFLTPDSRSGALSVSIVIYKPDLSLLERTFIALARASERLGGLRCNLTVVDNSTPAVTGACVHVLEEVLRAAPISVRWIAGHGNVGYGKGHNLAIDGADSTVHLVLNPDVELAVDALERALRFIDGHPDCVLLNPVASWPDGRTQHLCKRFPLPWVLFLRGFAPRWLKTRFDAVLADYEYRDAAQDQVLWDPLLVSGCCMFFRTDVLRRLGGFDPEFFLYFEDFDLSLRAARLGRLVRVPDVRVIHHGGHAARKGGRHVRLFLASAWRFYRRHGFHMRRGKR